MDYALAIDGVTVLATWIGSAVNRRDTKSNGQDAATRTALTSLMEAVTETRQVSRGGQGQSC